MGGFASRSRDPDTSVQGNRGGSRASHGDIAPAWSSPAHQEGHHMPMDSARLAVVGLDNSGKTSVCHLLRYQSLIECPPAPTHSVERSKARFEKKRLFLIDCPGFSALRHTWVDALREADAVIFVVDSSDTLRLQVAREELETTAQNFPPLLPLLIFANKQDAEGALPAPEVGEALEIKSLPHKNLHILPSSAVSGLGIPEGIDWILGPHYVQHQPSTSGSGVAGQLAQYFQEQDLGANPVNSAFTSHSGTSSIVSDLRELLPSKSDGGQLDDKALRNCLSILANLAKDDYLRLIMVEEGMVRRLLVGGVFLAATNEMITRGTIHPVVELICNLRMTMDDLLLCKPTREQERTLFSVVNYATAKLLGSVEGSDAVDDEYFLSSALMTMKTLASHAMFQHNEARLQHEKESGSVQEVKALYVASGFPSSAHPLIFNKFAGCSYRAPNAAANFNFLFGLSGADESKPHTVNATITAFGSSDVISLATATFAEGEDEVLLSSSFVDKLPAGVYVAEVNCYNSEEELLGGSFRQIFQNFIDVHGHDGGFQLWEQLGCDPKITQQLMEEESNKVVHIVL